MAHVAYEQSRRHADLSGVRAEPQHGHEQRVAGGALRAQRIHQPLQRHQHLARAREGGRREGRWGTGGVSKGE